MGLGTSFTLTTFTTPFLGVAELIIISQCMMVKCRKWVLRSHFSGLPKREDLEIVEEELPPLKDGGKAVQVYIH